MGTRVHYAEEVKWEVIKMKQAGMTNKEIMEQLGIKNKTQIKTWMRWYKTGQTYRFSQQVGKQYSYGYKKVELTSLEELVIKLCKKNFYHYGHRKIKSILNRKYGINVNRKTVQKIMQKFEIQCQVKKKRQKYTCGESNIIVPNTLNRNFKASRLNEKWVTDITYLPYGSTMLYLSTIMDLYNNEIVAYKIGTSQDINLVLDTLREAVELRKPVGLLLHSDQGSVYTSHAYQNLAKEKGITTSMSRKGNCHDNAAIESFHSSLKSEGFNAQSRASISNSKVVQIVNQYMYRYNHVRIQAKLNYLSPLEYRGQAA